MLTRQGETNGVQINGGAGASYTVFGNHLVYVLAKGQLKVARRFEDNYSLGAGASAGLLFFFRRSTAELSASGLRFALGETDSFYSAKWRQSFPLGKQSAIRYSLESRDERDNRFTQAELMLQMVFLAVLKSVFITVVLLIATGCTHFLFQPVREALFNPVEHGLAVENIYIEQDMRLHGWRLPAHGKIQRHFIVLSR